ncbi:MAG: alpha-N-acetylglucosaminidase TIM-barrel domain-containing protein, partial [Acutalibacteraceae bacterium]
MAENIIPIESDMIFASSDNDNASKAFDTKLRTKWTGGLYPGYVDINFGCYYQISGLKIETAKKGYCIFSVYSSVDGLNFDEKITQDSEIPQKGVYTFDCDFKSCALRIYIKYNSASDFTELRNVSVYGDKLDEEYKKPCVTYPVDFNDSKYNVSVSEKDTVAELHCLVARTVGEKYSESFVFEICDDGREYFEISDFNSKIKIRANSGVCAAAGLNHYYKYFCNVHISQVGQNTVMPENLPPVNKKIYMQTPFKVRYSYNYCALSYTMAFWKEDEWQKELDRLALQGVNVVLDITATEEVYRRFLLEIGYNMNEIKAFLTGPAYYAWFNMANIYGVGGPLPDGFFKMHTELARKNHLYMRKMGMQPVLQGYSGMVPIDIRKHIPAAPVIPQGRWNALDRPYMLRTDSEVYIKLARLFYKCQKDVFGDISHYYATDPFHEGGKSGRMKIENVGRQIMSSILECDPEGVWIIQSWGENPSKQLIDGIGENKDHAL